MSISIQNTSVAGIDLAPQEPGRARDVLRRHLGMSLVARTLGIAAISAVVLAIPSALISTPWFGRPVEPRAIDYVVLAISALLIGLIFALRPTSVAEARALAGSNEGDETRTTVAGFATFIAVGCPVCNQAVVALVGTSGALSWFAPVQPVIGVAAIGLLLYTLRRRLLSLNATSCPIG